MSAADDTLDALPGLPRGDDGPVFFAPWQAQAFAMAVRLNERGVFTWGEWAAALGEALREPDEDASSEDTYYLAWLRALERLLAEKGLVPDSERETRVGAWDRAARATPHGEPIVLGRDERSG